MKLEGPLVLEDGELGNLLPGGKPPRADVPSRHLERAVLSLLLLCAVVLFITNLPPAFRFGDFSGSAPKVSGDQFVQAIPARVLARLYEPSRPLKRGDFVVVNGAKSPSLRQIAATPNGTVLLRSGNSPKALYLVGQGAYVVVSETGSQIVRSSDIRATMVAMR